MTARQTSKNDRFDSRNPVPTDQPDWPARWNLVCGHAQWPVTGLYRP